MEWHQRLQQRIKELGWSKVELARRTGVDKERVYKWLAGDVDHPRGDALTALAKAVGLSEQELLYGLDARKHRSNDEKSNDESPPMRRIPLYEWGDIGVIAADRRKKPPVAVFTMPEPDTDVGPEAFYTTAQDDSNTPEIEEGDRILCDPSKPALPGRFVIAKIAGHKMPVLARYKIKKVKNGEPAEVELAPNNTDYAPIRIRKMSDLRILGRVTHRTHRL